VVKPQRNIITITEVNMVQSVPTQKQFIFFLDSVEKYQKNNKVLEVLEKGVDKDGTPIIAKEQFRDICEEILNSEDDEIRVDFARYLMFMGFLSIMNLTGKAISELKSGGAI
jgi:hypothetical protein